MSNQNYLEVLRDLGFSDQEIEVYISLLKTGGSDATSLSQRANLKRTTVYPILERLMKQGVVTAYGQKTLLFSPRPKQVGSSI